MTSFRNGPDPPLRDQGDARTDYRQPQRCFLLKFEVLNLLGGF
jgi:hypothetical protein